LTTGNDVNSSKTIFTLGARPVPFHSISVPFRLLALPKNLVTYILVDYVMTRVYHHYLFLVIIIAGPVCGHPKRYNGVAIFGHRSHQ